MSGERLDWVGLMHVGLHQLRLSVDEFWALTPNELSVKLGGANSAAQVMTKTGLGELLAQYPDTKVGETNGG